MPATITNDITGEARITTADGHSFGLLFNLRAIKGLELAFGQSMFGWLLAAKSNPPSVGTLEQLVVAGSAAYERSNGQGTPIAKVEALDVIEGAKFTDVLGIVIRSIALSMGLDDDEGDQEGDADDADPPGPGAAS